MKIHITKVLPNPWVPNDKPDADPLYTVHIEGQGEPQKTFDKALAVQGWHEAEEYHAKNGKVYWRSPKEAKAPAEKDYQYKADPIKQESIEWQACLKAAVEAVSNWHSLYSKDKVSLESYKKDIVEAVVTFTQTIKQKPEVIEKRVERMVDKGDYAQVNDEFDDGPPVENYENLM